MPNTHKPKGALKGGIILSLVYTLAIITLISTIPEDYHGQGFVIYYFVYIPIVFVVGATATHVALILSNKHKSKLKGWVYAILISIGIPLALFLIYFIIVSLVN